MIQQEKLLDLRSRQRVLGLTKRHHRHVRNVVRIEEQYLVAKVHHVHEVRKGRLRLPRDEVRLETIAESLNHATDEREKGREVPVVVTKGPEIVAPEGRMGVFIEREEVVEVEAEEVGVEVLFIHLRNAHLCRDVATSKVIIIMKGEAKVEAVTGGTAEGLKVGA